MVNYGDIKSKHDTTMENWNYTGRFRKYKLGMKSDISQIITVISQSSHQP